MFSAYYLMKLLEEAGLPPGVINFVPGDAAEISNVLLSHRDLAGVHFTGSTGVFNSMWKTIGANMSHYATYPRIVGETGGKDFIVAHPSADSQALAVAIARGGFEYPGTEVLGGEPRLRAALALERRARSHRRDDGRDEDGRHHRLPQLHGRGDRREVRSRRSASTSSTTRRRTRRSSPAAVRRRRRATSSARRSSRRPTRTIGCSARRSSDRSSRRTSTTTTKWDETLDDRRRDVAVRADRRGVRAAIARAIARR